MPVTKEEIAASLGAYGSCSSGSSVTPLGPRWPTGSSGSSTATPRPAARVGTWPSLSGRPSRC